ncbi:MAG: cytochrome c oxidase subunit 3, partial [Rhodospirillaceae bacterium]|nr:cytochrome c oxidase subunit 3 [Rhodospirillaceae bacterium]
MAEAQKHPYHLVDPSPWPFVGAMAALALFGGAVLWMHGTAAGPFIAMAGLLGVLFTM